jgi:hypothetical protein
VWYIQFRNKDTGVPKVGAPTKCFIAIEWQETTWSQCLEIPIDDVSTIAFVFHILKAIAQSTHYFGSITGITTIDVDDVVRLLVFAGPGRTAVLKR